MGLQPAFNLLFYREIRLRHKVLARFFIDL
jgi:hypothetical protein